MTDRTERVVISAIALSLPLAGMVTALLRHQRVFEYTTGRTIAGVAFEIVALFIGWRILRTRGWKSLPFRLHINLTNLIGGLLCIPTYLILTWVVYAVGRPFVPDPSVVLRHTAPPWLTIVYIVVNAYFEESFDSAYLIESFERTGNQHPLTWAAAIRASYNLYQGPLAAICVLFLGLAFGAIYRRTRDISLPFIAHAAINITIFGLSG